MPKRILVAALAIAGLAACRPIPAPIPMQQTTGPNGQCHIIWDDEFDEYFESFTPELRPDGRWYDARYDRPIGYSFPGYTHALIDCGFWGTAS